MAKIEIKYFFLLLRKIPKAEKLYTRIGWQGLVLMLLIILYLTPSLFVPWMIIDDGISIQNAQKISQSVMSFDFEGVLDVFAENEGGRYRPMYWLYYWVSYLIVGKSAFGHHLIHFIIVGLSVYILYLVINKLTSSKTTALFTSSLFLLTPLNIENWYRLGTPEPMFTFYIALSIYLLLIISTAVKPLKRHKWYLLFSVVLLIMAYFTKETIMAFFPFLIFLFLGRFWIKKKNERRTWTNNTLSVLFAGFFLTLIAIYINFFVRKQGAYSINYSFSLESSINAAEGYLRGIYQSFGFFPKILILSYIVSVVNSIRRRELSFKQYLQFTFLIGSVAFMVIQLPWGFVLGRYLEPVLFFLAVAFSFEVDKVLKFIQGLPRINIQLSVWDRVAKFSYSARSITLLILAFFYSLFLYQNTASAFNYISDTILGSKMIAKTLRFTASQTRQDGRVFMNLKKGDATVELVLESALHLNIFYNRPDIKVDYLDEEKLANLKEGDVVVSAFAGSSLVNYDDGVLQKNNNIKKVWNMYHRVPNMWLTLPPPRLIASFVLQRKTKGLENLFRYSTSENLWRVYKVI